MHAELLQNLQHHHDFVTINKKGERRTRQVLVLTFLMMALEIAAGIVFGSMALLAICVISSFVGIRKALKVEPAEALGG